MNVSREKLKSKNYKLRNNKDKKKYKKNQKKKIEKNQNN